MNGPQLRDFLTLNFCVDSLEITSNGALQLKGCGDWGLTIYTFPIGKHGMQSPEDVIDKFLGADYVREDEMEVYESITLMKILEELSIELEELKPAKSKIKTFEGLPIKFGKCIKTCCDGNSKCFVGLANSRVYVMNYCTS